MDFSIIDLVSAQKELLAVWSAELLTVKLKCTMLAKGTINLSTSKPVYIPFIFPCTIVTSFSYLRF